MITLLFSSPQPLAKENVLINFKRNYKHDKDICSKFMSFVIYLIQTPHSTKKYLQSLVCSSPLCFLNALGSFVGCSQYTANLFFYTCIFYYMSPGLHVSTSLYFRPSSDPSINCLAHLQCQFVIWLILLSNKTR